jgi:hypothetical protein
MASSGLCIIVTSLVAQYSLGGVTWDYLQFALGLARLGHDVYCLEDTGQWPSSLGEKGELARAASSTRARAGIRCSPPSPFRWIASSSPRAPAAECVSVDPGRRGW